MKRLYFSKLLILSAILLGANWNTFAQTTTFSYTAPVIQSYTVPAGACSMSISAKGAQGGSMTINATGGGVGAIMQGTFNAIPGHVLNIIVGQQGATASYVGGGGGGSYVWDVTAGNVLLMAAGGGGGAGRNDNSATGITGGNAATTTLGSNGSTMPNGAGTAGNAATAPTGVYDYAGGGGGWNIGTGNSGTAYACGSTLCTGGQSALSGGAGGTGNGASGATTNGPLGGFGGGGGGNGRCGAVGAGGGGGYSGGGAGGETTSSAFIYSAGGGGGSFNGGITQSNSVGNTGNGQVVITILCSPIGAM